MKCAVNRGPVRSVALATTQAAPAAELQTVIGGSRHAGHSACVRDRSEHLVARADKAFQHDVQLVSRKRLME
jgi:hypothetical protein